MIATARPAVVIGLAAAGLLLAILPAGLGRSPKPKAISGALYTAGSAKTAPSTPPELPRVNLGASPEIRRLLPGGSDFVVHLVDVKQSSFTLTTAKAFEQRSATARLPRAKRSKANRIKAPAPKPAPIIPAAPMTPAPPAPAPAPVAPPKPAAPVLPTLPKTFTEIDQALRNSSTTQAVNVRIKKGGISFRLTHIGRVGDRYVLRFGVANEEAADFFLSIINVTAAGKAIPSETAGPYACQAGQEIFGVVYFKPADVAGKAVSVELIQSGGDRRHFKLEANYSF